MQASPTVAATIEPYIDELRAQGKSAGTIRLYSGYLRRLAKSCDEVSRSACLVKNIDARHTARVRARYSSNTTRNICETVLRGWLNWCVRMRYITEARAMAAQGHVKYKKHIRKPKVYIPAVQFQGCLEAAGAWHPRSRAIVACALYTLGREGELESIQLKDFDLRKLGVELYRSKRQRWTTAPITPDFLSELDLWLTWYAADQGYGSPAAMIAEHPEWYLLPRLDWVGGGGRTADERSRHGRHVMHPETQGRQFRAVIKRTMDAMGIESREHGKSVRHLGEGVHTIRRSGARAMLDFLTDNIGADRALLQVSLMLDHEDTRVTLLYIGLDLERERLNDFLRTNSMYAVNPSRRATAGGTVTSIARSRTQPNTLRELPQNEEAGSN